MRRSFWICVLVFVLDLGLVGVAGAQDKDAKAAEAKAGEKCDAKEESS